MSRPSAKLDVVIDRLLSLRLSDGTLQISNGTFESILDDLLAARSSCSEIEARSNAAAIHMLDSASKLVATASAIPSILDRDKASHRQECQT